MNKFIYVNDDEILECISDTVLIYFYEETNDFGTFWRTQATPSFKPDSAADYNQYAIKLNESIKKPFKNKKSIIKVQLNVLKKFGYILVKDHQRSMI